MSKAQFGFHLSVQGLLASTCPSANTAPLRVPFLPNRDWDRVAAANTRAAQNTLGFDSHVGTLYHASYNFAASGALTFGPSIVGSTTAATQANLSEHSAISLPELNQAPQSQAIPHNPLINLRWGLLVLRTTDSHSRAQQFHRLPHAILATSNSRHVTSATTYQQRSTHQKAVCAPEDPPRLTHGGDLSAK